jgi:ABC-type multidrug transport system fused ATPase/permease subunit
MMFSGLIDLFGIVSIFPFLSVAANPTLIESNQYLAKLNSWAKLDSGEILILLGIFSLLVLLFNQAVRVGCLWYVQWVNYRIWRILHERMFRYYLNQPYVYHLGASGNALLEKLQLRVGAAVDGVISPMFMLASSFFTVVFIAGMLMWVEPIVTLMIVFLVGAFYFLIYQKIKRYIDRYGETLPEFSAKAFHLITESFGAIKEIKLKRNGDYYVNQFRPLAKEFCDAKLKGDLYAVVPSSLVEVLAFLGIFIVTLILMSSKGGLQESVPIIGVYALALRRILPAVQKIYWQTFQIRYHYPSFRIVYDDLRSAYRSEQENLRGRLHEENMVLTKELLVKQLSFSYPQFKTRVLDSISLEIPTGSMIGIAGVSGAGKTTLADLVLGLYQPTSGAILIDGKLLDSETIPKWQAQLGYVSQAPYIADGTIARNIAFGVPESQINLRRVRDVARIAELSTFIESELPDQYETFVGERGVRLSGGQRQRLSIARALYQDPKLLIFDEATSALDGITEAQIMESIKLNLGEKTILMIAHRLTTLKKCDNIFLLDKGKLIAQGNYQNLMDKNQTFRRMANEENMRRSDESRRNLDDSENT